MLRESLAAFEKETSVTSRTEKSALKRVKSEQEHGNKVDFREFERKIERCK